jgi:beta-phosphoglucomutase-like phosphatase (HAD superfamily)
MVDQQKNSPQAVIFDVDGTLLNSVDEHARAWVDAFREYGHRVCFEQVRRQIGKGSDQLLPVFMTSEEIEEYGEALDSERGRILKDRYLSLMKPFPDVRGLLERLKGDAKLIALASSATRDDVAVYKRIANIEDLVDVETSSDDARRSKPAPDIFRDAIERPRWHPSPPHDRRWPYRL